MDILMFLAAPFVASLILTGIHAYLGVHVVERGVIFVDLSLAQIAALGASVVGISADDIDTLSKFSVQACQSKFPVASDTTQAVMKSFDAVMHTRPEYANRISYVIAPDGSIVYHYMSLNPTRHVERMLAALRSWSEKKEKK